MNVTTIDNHPSHFYQTGKIEFAIGTRDDVTIVHKHSSIVTCRGFDHAVIIPSQTDE